MLHERNYFLTLQHNSINTRVFVFLADEPRKFINGKRGQTLCFSMYAYHYVYRFSVGCCFFLYHGFPRTYQLKKDLTPTFFYCFHKERTAREYTENP